MSLQGPCARHGMAIERIAIWNATLVLEAGSYS
ncbi:hypothetical protein QE370_000518 [Aeromicrobium sp. SORGH_AS981]|nr:hypothetical protein [Aeromicrobium sp. SORGH_AS_0981]